MGKNGRGDVECLGLGKIFYLAVPFAVEWDSFLLVMQQIIIGRNAILYILAVF